MKSDRQDREKGVSKVQTRNKNKDLLMVSSSKGKATYIGRVKGDGDQRRYRKKRENKTDITTNYITTRKEEGGLRAVYKSRASGNRRSILQYSASA